MERPPIELQRPEARRFALRAAGLIEPHKDVGEALGYHGFVQVDPLNVCGRMQEHILRTRVTNYAEGGLHRYAHGVDEGARRAELSHPVEARTAFEHFHPSRTVLAVFPASAWPYLRRGMMRRARTPGRWMGKLTEEERPLARSILAEIRERGALSSADIASDTRASKTSHNGWTPSRLSKVVMDKLFGHGRLLISRRGTGGRRVYDLPERVLPQGVLRLPAPRAAEWSRWVAELKLRQHRLIPLKKSELPHLAKIVQRVHVPDCPALYCLRSDLPLLDASGEAPSAERLLAPLDPLIIDRSVVSRLWDFDYTWEVYTPAAKRKRGYYALPILAGDRFVGHVDLKVDRAAGRLRVVGRSCARGYRSAPAVAQLAEFLALR